MMSRPSLLAFTLLVAALGAAVPALAIKVDPDLAAVLAGKSQDDLVPVLLIYEGDQRPDAALLADLEGATPRKRRDQVVAALKKKMKSLQAAAMSVGVRATRMGRAMMEA